MERKLTTVEVTAVKNRVTDCPYSTDHVIDNQQKRDKEVFVGASLGIEQADIRHSTMKMTLNSILTLAVLLFCGNVSAVLTSSTTNVKPISVFSVPQNVQTVESLKSQILQLGASLDRGQSYNPTSGPYYADRMAVARWA